MGQSMLKQLARTVAQRESLILIYAASLLCFLGYHSRLGLLPTEYGLIETRLTQAVLYLGASFLFSVAVLRENPLKFGLGAGDTRAWGRYLLLFAAVMGVAVLAVSRAVPGFSAYYPVYAGARANHGLFALYALSVVAYMFAWEYFFRGFLLFSLAKRYGDGAVVLQALPFALLHIGKPELEAYSSIAGGIILGVLALRTRSMWPCFLLHAFVAVWMDVCVVYIWA